MTDNMEAVREAAGQLCVDAVTRAFQRNQMIYAELVTDRIEDRGVFFTLSEYLPYRLQGWSSEPDIDESADKRLTELAAMSDAQIAYCSPMIRFGEDYRTEQVRRLRCKEDGEDE